MEIIAILLSIAVPPYLGFKDKAQKTAAVSDVREAIPAIEAFYSYTARIPASTPPVPPARG
jgi:type II secretory pathway pseudopilin PulG